MAAKIPSPPLLLRGMLRAGLILLGLLWAPALPTGADPLPFTAVLTAMQARLADTADYQCRLETWSTNGNTSRPVLLAYAFRRPAKVRMEVLEGPYAGSLLIYDRERAPARVRALAGNPLLAFLQRIFWERASKANGFWRKPLQHLGADGEDHFLVVHQEQGFTAMDALGGRCGFGRRRSIGGREQNGERGAPALPAVHFDNALVMGPDAVKTVKRVLCDSCNAAFRSKAPFIHSLLGDQAG